MGVNIISQGVRTGLSRPVDALRAAPFLLIACLIAGAFLAPGVPFIIDGGIYLDMARSLVEGHTLSIGGNGGVDGAPALTKFLTVAHDGQVMPQYPNGYAFLAAPFYALFGVHGLMAMNALSFALCIRLTHSLAKNFYTEDAARWAAGIFAAASFAPTYVFGIWPHMVALAFWLGAICFAVAGHQAEDRNRRWRCLFFSGLLIGAGINVRIDLFLAALVIFFWLRIFALPRDRLAPLMLTLGMIPGLLIAAWLNFVKFGAFMPFTYGDASGLDSMSPYLPIAAAAAGAFAVLWAVNVQPFAQAALTPRYRPYAALAVAGAIATILALTPLRDFIWRELTGLYVLVINLQAHDAYHQAGVERNAYGHLLFWGYPKKALIQSLPWMTLLILPAWNALRGRNVAAAALCFLAIAAPVCFYAMNHWHGGGSYSMRYFMPALPFLAILAAAGFDELRKNAAVERQTILAILTVAAMLYLGLQELGQAQERFFAPGALYPQWIIAGILAALVLSYLVTHKDSIRKVCVSVSLFAFAYAAAINIYEEVVHERTRTEQRAIAADISAPIPAGALVLTPMQTTLIPAERRGAFVMASGDRWAEEGGAAAMAFARAGRCVYFHNPVALNVVRPYLTAPVDPAPLSAPSAQFGDDPRLAFFTFANAPDACRTPFRKP